MANIPQKKRKMSKKKPKKAPRKNPQNAQKKASKKASKKKPQKAQRKTPKKANKRAPMKESPVKSAPDFFIGSLYDLDSIDRLSSYDSDVNILEWSKTDDGVIVKISDDGTEKTFEYTGGVIVQEGQIDNEKLIFDWTEDYATRYRAHLINMTQKALYEGVSRCGVVGDIEEVPSDIRAVVNTKNGEHLLIVNWRTYGESFERDWGTAIVHLHK